MQLNLCKKLRIDPDIKQRLYISPPFGNYISTPVTTSVRGSYTWHFRPGVIKQFLKTVRPIEGGYVNRMGLRNPGIRNILLNSHDVFSIVGMDEKEWDYIYDYLPNTTKLEINIGCPNSWGMCFTKEHLKKYVDKFPNIIMKFSPKISLDDIRSYHDSGITQLHLSNSLPTERGGVAGAQQKEFNLPLLEKVRVLLPHSFIIAGGGIYTIEDAKDYMNVGADGYSLSTVWFNPLKGIKLVRQIKEEILEKKTIGEKNDLQLRPIS